MNPSVPTRIGRAARLALFLSAVVVAAQLGGCSEEGTSGPDQPDPPDISTPRGAVDALEVQYSYRRADEAIALLAPGYHFIPLDPTEISFLEPGETSWAHADESASVVPVPINIPTDAANTRVRVLHIEFLRLSGLFRLPVTAEEPTGR